VAEYLVDYLSRQTNEWWSGDDPVPRQKDAGDERRSFRRTITDDMNQRAREDWNHESAVPSSEQGTTTDVWLYFRRGLNE
jgi:hypothetical protein